MISTVRGIKASNLRLPEVLSLCICYLSVNSAIIERTACNAMYKVKVTHRGVCFGAVTISWLDLVRRPLHASGIWFPRDATGEIPNGGWFAGLD